MDPNRAIQFGLLVQAAYVLASGISNDNLPKVGSILDAAFDPFGVGYTIESVICGNELALTVKGPLYVSVPIGLILSTSQNDIVVAMRGSERVWEWLHDVAFLQEKCYITEGAGYTEDGFAALYRSLHVNSYRQSVLATLNNWRKPISSITICGHSMGGALATLLALDISANSCLAGLISVITFASPRTGDRVFADLYDRMVPSTVRIANRCDIVPYLPPAPMYKHVDKLLELNPISSGVSLRILLSCTIPCQHEMLSYLYLLSLLPGATLLQSPNPKCRSSASYSLADFTAIENGGDIGSA